MSCTSSKKAFQLNRNPAIEWMCIYRLKKIDFIQPDTNTQVENCFSTMEMFKEQLNTSAQPYSALKKIWKWYLKGALLGGLTVTGDKQGGLQ